MRLARNLVVLILLAMVSQFAPTSLDAYPITSGPFCDDPGENQVTFGANGNCSEAESDCSDACYECYLIFPKHVDIMSCNAGEMTYAAECACNLAR